MYVHSAVDLRQRPYCRNIFLNKRSHLGMRRPLAVFCIALLRVPKHFNWVTDLKRDNKNKFVENRLNCFFNFGTNLIGVTVLVHPIQKSILAQNKVKTKKELHCSWIVFVTVYLGKAIEFSAAILFWKVKNAAVCFWRGKTLTVSSFTS